MDHFKILSRVRRNISCCFLREKVAQTSHHNFDVLPERKIQNSGRRICDRMITSRRTHVDAKLIGRLKEFDNVTYITIPFVSKLL